MALFKGNIPKIIDALKNQNPTQPITELEITLDSNTPLTDHSQAFELGNLISKNKDLSKITLKGNDEKILNSDNYKAALIAPLYVNKSINTLSVSEYKLSAEVLFILNHLKGERRLSGKDSAISIELHPDNINDINLHSDTFPHLSNLKPAKTKKNISFFGYILRCLKIIRTLASHLLGMAIGMVLGGISSLFIHNPITCLLATLDGTEWRSYGIIGNSLRVLLSPWAFPIVAVLDAIIDGAKVGAKYGLFRSLTVPYREWKYAPYTNFEILAPWAAVVLTVSGLWLYAGLPIAGAVSLASWSTFAATALTWATNIAIAAGITTAVYGAYEFIKGRIFKGGTRRDAYIRQSYVTEAVANKYLAWDNTASKKYFKSEDITPTEWGRFFQLPPSLDNANSTPVVHYFEDYYRTATSYRSK